MSARKKTNKRCRQSEPNFDLIPQTLVVISENLKKELCAQDNSDDIPEPGL